MSNIFKDTKLFHKKHFGHAAEKKIESLTRRNTKKFKKVYSNAKRDIENSFILLPNEPGYIKADNNEIIFKLTQAKILDNVDLGTRKKAFNLQLSHGPYMIDYTPNGRYMLIGGDKGQLSMIDVHQYKSFFDITVKETIRDVVFLHCHEMIAIAQKKYVHVYDNNGAEVYCLRDRLITHKLEYLYYHYLLTSIGEFGELCWQDVSTGEVVAKHATRRGSCKIMKQNKSNAVIHLGHNDGIVTLWVPNIANACVEMLCHKGPVTAMSVHDPYMITSGMDGFWKVWDLRNYKECLKKEFVGSTPPTSMDTSQTGVLSLSVGGKIEFYRDIFKQNGVGKPDLYLTHRLQSQIIKCISFQPFEDVCAVGSTFGVSTLIIPGSGIANFDSMEQNPYASDSNLQIQRLLDKLPADSITLNRQAIGSYSRDLALPDPTKEDGNLQQRATKVSKKNPKKKHKKSKAEKYNKTFVRRQQAIADRLMNLKTKMPQLPKEEAKREIIKQMSTSKDEVVIKGPVKGAALGRYYKK